MSQNLFWLILYKYLKIGNNKTYNLKGGNKMKVKDCMCTDLCYCAPDMTVSEVAKLMNEHHIGCLPVCDSNQSVVGLVTDRDIALRCVACDKNEKETPVSEIMTCSVCCCNGDTELSEATKLMSDLQIRRIPVIENNKIIGMLTIGDLAKNQDISPKDVGDTFEHICGCGHNSKNAE